MISHRTQAICVFTARTALLAAAILLAGGCLTPSRVALPTRYLLTPACDVTKAQSGGLSLGIRPIEAARPYRQKIMYREAGLVLREYPGAEWAELPADVATRALTDALVATGRYTDVGNAADMRVPDLILTGHLRKFDEVRTANPWTAECEIRFELRNNNDTQSAWSVTLSASEPLERNEPSALAEAMSRALARVINQAANEIAKQ